MFEGPLRSVVASVPKPTLTGLTLQADQVVRAKVVAALTKQKKIDLAEFEEAVRGMPIDSAQ
jgi:hypothetical protein